MLATSHSDHMGICCFLSCLQSHRFSYMNSFYSRILHTLPDLFSQCYSRLFACNWCFSSAIVSSEHSISGARTAAEHLPSIASIALVGDGFDSTNSELIRKNCSKRSDAR